MRVTLFGRRDSKKQRVENYKAFLKQTQEIIMDIFSNFPQFLDNLSFDCRDTYCILWLSSHCGAIL
jgi:hypothetical protein